MFGIKVVSRGVHSIVGARACISKGVSTGEGHIWSWRRGGNDSGVNRVGDMVESPQQ
jgi:hypothetical protein